MSITLNANQVQTVTLGGVTVETDTQGAAQRMIVNFNGPDITLTFAKGTVSDANFSEGLASRITATINVTTGFWQSSNGLSGTLSQFSITNLIALVKGWRNTAEQFAIDANILPGIQVPWA